MVREIIVGSRRINDDGDCFVIAEIGNNHQGSLEMAKEMFRMAKQSGADAVKLQKRNIRALYTRELYESPYDNENSFGPTYGAHREALEFGLDQYLELKQYAEQLGLIMFATAFDFSSVDFLEEVDIPAYKIASGDLCNTPLLKRVARLGKPLFVSTGGGSVEDVQRAYETIMPINRQLCLLQCTASYPAQPEDMNLQVITAYKEKFPDAVIGLSDHQNGIAMSLVAYMLGARVFEKHFTLNRALKGTDHSFSLEPAGLQKMIRDLKRARAAMGDGIKRLLPCEAKPIFKMGKKLVAAHALPAGHVLTIEDIAIKSPSGGIPPYELDRVIGKAVPRSLREDESLPVELLQIGERA